MVVWVLPTNLYIYKLFGYGSDSSVNLSVYIFISRIRFPVAWLCGWVLPTAEVFTCSSCLILRPTVASHVVPHIFMRYVWVERLSVVASWCSRMVAGCVLRRF